MFCSTKFGCAKNQIWYGKNQIWVLSTVSYSARLKSAPSKYPAVTVGGQSRRVSEANYGLNVAEKQKFVKNNLLRRKKIMANTKASNDLYKKFICDMIQEIDDNKFLQQLYSIVLKEYKKTGN